MPAALTLVQPPDVETRDAKPRAERVFAGELPRVSPGNAEVKDRPAVGEHERGPLLGGEAAAVGPRDGDCVARTARVQRRNAAAALPESRQARAQSRARPRLFPRNDDHGEARRRG